MHALMQMRYPLTCQNLDVSLSPSGTPSPPTFAFVNRYYDPLRLQSNSNKAPYSPQKNGSSAGMTGARAAPKVSSRKLDFSIESILGLDKSDKFSPAVSRICEADCRETRLLTPKASYSVSAVFPDSLELEKKSRNEESDIDTRYTLLSSSSSNPKPSNSNNQKSPPHHSVGKAKRIRTIFTPDQLERLECEFERQQYMVGPERMYLASGLNLSESQVKIWFQNRRIKWRKQHLEMQQARLAQLREAETVEHESDSDQASLVVKEPSPSHWEIMEDRN